MTWALSARLAQTPTPEALVVSEVVVSIDGSTIVAVEPADSPAAKALIEDSESHEVLGADTWLLPGMVDLHVHAPQWPQLGTGLDLPLQRWLFDHTFPLEARYDDLDFARVVWRDLVTTLLAHGTTTAVYFGTVHEAATTELARTCLEHGQRALVGRVGMDHPDGTPTWYRDRDATAGITASAGSIDAIRALAGPPGLVGPIVTPRFTPACTDDLLQGLAELAESTGTRVQTHCSESDWEHGYALDRFDCSDAVALDRFGLVRDHSVLAHADFVGDDDLALIADRGAAIAHCPLSNAYFGNAVFPVRRALGAGVRVGLGTDIAGGAAPGVMSQCHWAVTMSRLLEDGVDPTRSSADRGTRDSRIDTVTAFWLATMGGAEAVGLPVGLIEPGRRFDAVAIAVDGDHGAIRLWDDIDDDVRAFEKIIRLAGPSDIRRVWVDGRTVIGN